VTVIRRALRSAFAVLLRVLAAMGGAVAAYGATGMFTSGGLMPPNVIVLAGLAMCGLTVVALAVSERRLDGLWPALLSIGVPNALYALGSWSVSECAPDHSPITSLSPLTCSPVGTHAIAIVAPVIALIGLVLLARDIRALAKRDPRRSELP
jgi:hypothetical protein